MDYSFKGYCGQRMLAENSPYTDSLASSYYHDEHDTMERLAKANPSMYRRFAAKFMKLNDAVKESQQEVQKAQHLLTMHQSNLRRLQKQYDDLRFKLAQSATDYAHDVPSMARGLPQHPTQSGEMDAMPHGQPRPSELDRPAVPGEGASGAGVARPQYGSDPTQYRAGSRVEPDRMGGTLRHDYRPRN
jgi:ABC-type transporter Mla subunit MlaD